MFNKYAIDGNESTPIQTVGKIKKRPSQLDTSDEVVYNDKTSRAYIKRKKLLYDYSPASDVDESSDDEDLVKSLSKKLRASSLSMSKEENLLNISQPSFFATPANTSDVIKIWNKIPRTAPLKR